MPLPLKQAQAISELATALYGFLPGGAHPYADQSISFAGIARELGLGAHWTGGSKLPALTRLLTGTVEQRPQDFSRLMIEIVRRGLGYRASRSRPLTKEEMSALNGLIAMVGFKIPELVDPAFLGSLPRDDSRNQKVDPPSEAIAALSLDFGALAQLEPQQRGYAFEIFLNTLFKVYGLDPRQPFRLVGEQIDGSFQLNGDTYLVEARWRNQQADAADLAVLSTKVAGKAQWSRCIYISYAGFTADGLTAFARGKSTNVICIDGLDLVHILQGGLNLVDVLRRKARRAAETNDAFVPVRDLFMGVT